MLTPENVVRFLIENCPVRSRMEGGEGAYTLPLTR